MILGEPMHAIQLAGAALVLAGVLLVIARSARARAERRASVKWRARSARRRSPGDPPWPPTRSNATLPALKDPALLRQQCYVDGQWIDADGGATLAVVNPATGAHDRHRAAVRRRRDAPRDRRGGARVARVAREDREGAQRDPAQAGSS